MEFSLEIRSQSWHHSVSCMWEIFILRRTSCWHYVRRLSRSHSKWSISTSCGCQVGILEWNRIDKWPSAAYLCEHGRVCILYSFLGSRLALDSIFELCLPFGIELSRERAFLFLGSWSAWARSNILLLQRALDGWHRCVRNTEIVKSALELILASQACSFSSKGGLPVISPFGNFEILT